MKVYISGPYSGDSTEENVKKAIEAGQKLLEAGHEPFVPHLFYFWEKEHGNSYDTWLSLDLAWLESCQIIVRLPGESPGADKEIEAAKMLRIPVYYSVEDFLKAPICKTCGSTLTFDVRKHTEYRAIKKGKIFVPGEVISTDTDSELCCPRCGTISNLDEEENEN